MPETLETLNQEKESPFWGSAFDPAINAIAWNLISAIGDEMLHPETRRDTATLIERINLLGFEKGREFLVILNTTMETHGMNLFLAEELLRPWCESQGIPYPLFKPEKQALDLEP